MSILLTLASCMLEVQAGNIDFVFHITYVLLACPTEADWKRCYAGLETNRGAALTRWPRYPDVLS